MYVYRYSQPGTCIAAAGSTSSSIPSTAAVVCVECSFSCSRNTTSRSVARRVASLVLRGGRHQREGGREGEPRLPLLVLSAFRLWCAGVRSW